MERQGIPAAVICTGLFVAQGRAMASAHGYENYPLAEVFHPISNALPSALQAEAERVLDRVLAMLTTPSMPTSGFHPK